MPTSSLSVFAMVTPFHSQIFVTGSEPTIDTDYSLRYDVIASKKMERNLETRVCWLKRHCNQHNTAIKMLPVFVTLNNIECEGVATEAKMTAESRTLAPESPIGLRYFEARITRISYTLGRSCDPLDRMRSNCDQGSFVVAVDRYKLANRKKKKMLELTNRRGYLTGSLGRNDGRTFWCRNGKKNSVPFWPKKKRKKLGPQKLRPD